MSWNEKTPSWILHTYAQLHFNAACFGPQGASYSSVNERGLSLSNLERRFAEKSMEARDFSPERNSTEISQCGLNSAWSYITLGIKYAFDNGYGHHISPVDKIRAASSSFPYVDHYVDMVEKESRIIDKFLLDGIGQGPNTITDTEGDDWKRTVLFCGSGPLPLTGILMAMFLKVRVILVDCDEDAVNTSRRLITHWEKENFIPVGVISVICAKGEDLTFCNSNSTPESHRDDRVVPYHVLFIADLISNEVKEYMVRKISALELARPLVVMRTAHGLTARFAYFQTSRKSLTKYMELIGIVAPETPRDSNGFVVDDHVRPIGVFSSTILDSLELYSWK